MGGIGDSAGLQIIILNHDGSQITVSEDELIELTKRTLESFYNNLDDLMKRCGLKKYYFGTSQFGIPCLHNLITNFKKEVQSRNRILILKTVSDLREKHQKELENWIALAKELGVKICVPSAEIGDFD